MLDLVAPQPAQLRDAAASIERGARRRAGAGLLRARLFAQRRRGRDLAAHEQPGEDDERGHREGPPRAAAHRHRFARCAPRSRPQRSDAHDRADANLLAVPPPCSIRAERSIGCRARSPRRRSSACWSIRRSSAGSRGSGRIRMLVALAASPSRTSPSASASMRRCSIGWRPRRRARLRRNRRGADQLGLLPAARPGGRPTRASPAPGGCSVPDSCAGGASALCVDRRRIALLWR